jgi:hypothetical protein
MDVPILNRSCAATNKKSKNCIFKFMDDVALLRLVFARRMITLVSPDEKDVRQH